MSRYDDMSEQARFYLSNCDEIELAEMCARSSARIERLEAELTESRGQVGRVRKALAERRAEVADYEAELPASAWSDAVTVTCNRIDDALRVFPPPTGIRVGSTPEPPAEYVDPNPTIPAKEHS